MSKRWRVGRKVGRTIYRGDNPGDLIGVMDTREDAALVVEAVNRLFEEKMATNRATKPDEEVG